MAEIQNTPTEKHYLYSDEWARLINIKRIFEIDLKNEFNLNLNLEELKLRVAHFMRIFIDILHNNLFNLYLSFLNEEIDFKNSVDDFLGELIDAEDLNQLFIAAVSFRDSFKKFFFRVLSCVTEKIDNQINSDLLVTFCDRIRNVTNYSP